MIRERAAWRDKIEIIPDELCQHVEMGVPIAGGFLFTGEPEPIAMAMCQECLDWCHAEFQNPQKLEGLVEPAK